MVVDPDLVIVSKSPWQPATRREHALASQAVDHRLDVAFLEAPTDIRAFGRPGERGRWVRGLSRPRRVASGRDRLGVYARSTIFPGHRGAPALSLETRILRRHLRLFRPQPDGVTVATVPWTWPAVASVPTGRRVADLADDWAHLIPERAELIRTLYRRIADEADEIVVAAPELADCFPGRSVRVVRNATDDAMVSLPLTSRPGERRIVAVGTLSERFDDELADAVLDRLPGWTLQLFGEMRYAGAAGVPSAGLSRLLGRADGRATYGGVVARPDLTRVIDNADVLLVAHRPQFTAGQDSMKLYDYSSRGRPVIAGDAGLPARRPPHLRVCADAAGMADAIVKASHEDDSLSVDRVAWARTNVWSARWVEWWAAVTGTHSGVVTRAR